MTFRHNRARFWNVHVEIALSAPMPCVDNIATTNYSAEMSGRVVEALAC